jgi:acyl dehydratase
MAGLSVGATKLGTLVANLRYDAVIMPKPIVIGVTLRAERVTLALDWKMLDLPYLKQAMRRLSRLPAT